MANFGLGTKVVIHNHNFHQSSSLVRRFFRHILRFVYSRLSHGRVACSLSSGRQMFSNDFFILKNAVNYSEHTFDRVKRERTRNELSVSEKYVLLNVGNLHPQKNQIFLLEIAKALVFKGVKDFVVLIVGEDYSQFNELSSMIVRDNLSDYVRLCGPSDDVQSFLSAADIFLFPSLFEGFGMALLEAQIAGLKCLASNQIPKDAEISNNVRWLDINKSSVHKWVEEIISARDGKNSPDRKPILFENFNLPDVANELFEYYLKIVKE